MEIPTNDDRADIDLAYEKVMAQNTDWPDSVCQWCGRDCGFMRTAPGLCLSCGDRMQSMPPDDLMLAVAKAIGENAQLSKTLRDAGLAVPIGGDAVAFHVIQTLASAVVQNARIRKAFRNANLPLP